MKIIKLITKIVKISFIISILKFKNETKFNQHEINWINFESVLKFDKRLFDYFVLYWLNSTKVSIYILFETILIVWKCQIHFCTKIEKYTFIHWMHSVQSKQKVYAISTFDWKCIELGRRLQSYNKQWLKELSCCYRECDSASQNLKITYGSCVLEMSLFVRKSRVLMIF